MSEGFKEGHHEHPRARTVTEQFPPLTNRNAKTVGEKRKKKYNYVQANISKNMLLVIEIN